MKKIILAISSVLFVITTQAQSKKMIIEKNPHPHLNKMVNQNTHLPVSSSSAVSQLIWEDDFSDSTNWVVWHDITACDLDWQIGNYSCQGSYPISDIASTTAANGYALMDSDFYGGATGGNEMEDCWLTTKNPIDLTGFPDVVLEFETYYRSFNNEKAFIVVGVGDGSGNVVWPDLTASSGTSTGTPAVLPNNVFVPFPDYGTGDASDNPELITVNISSALVGLTPQQLTDIYIRFHWTGTWGYAWFVDDVALRVTPDNKITTKDVVFGGYWVDYANYSSPVDNEIIGLDYSITPLSQIAAHPYAIEAKVKNEGLSVQHVELSYNITGPSPAAAASSIIVLQPQEDTAMTTPLFSPTVTGNYTIDVMTMADSAGYGTTFTYTDTVTKQIVVSDYIYGKDLNNPNTNSSLMGGPNDEWHYTTRYEMYANEQLYSIRAYIGSESIPGAVIKGIIYEVDTTATSDVSLLYSSDYYVITAQDLGAWVDIPVVDFSGNPISLFTGYAYEIGVSGFQSASDSSFIGTSGGSMYNGEHSVFDVYGLNPSTTGTPGTPTWYYTTRCPMIRMNFDPNSVPQPSAINDLGSDISIYPNPTSGIFTIELDAVKELDVKVYNVIGQLVYTVETSSLITKIDLSGYDKGIYTIELEANSTTHQKKIVVE